MEDAGDGKNGKNGKNGENVEVKTENDNDAATEAADGVKDGDGDDAEDCRNGKNGKNDKEDGESAAKNGGEPSPSPKAENDESAAKSPDAERRRRRSSRKHSHSPAYVDSLPIGSVAIEPESDPFLTDSDDEYRPQVKKVKSMKKVTPKRKTLAEQRSSCELRAPLEFRQQEPILPNSSNPPNPPNAPSPLVELVGGFAPIRIRAGGAHASAPPAFASAYPSPSPSRVALGRKSVRSALRRLVDFSNALRRNCEAVAENLKSATTAEGVAECAAGATRLYEDASRELGELNAAHRRANDEATPRRDFANGGRHRRGSDSLSLSIDSDCEIVETQMDPAVSEALRKMKRRGVVLKTAAPACVETRRAISLPGRGVIRFGEDIAVKKITVRREADRLSPVRLRDVTDLAWSSRVGWLDLAYERLDRKFAADPQFRLFYGEVDVELPELVYVASAESYDSRPRKKSKYADSSFAESDVDSFSDVDSSSNFDSTSSTVVDDDEREENFPSASANEAAKASMLYDSSSEEMSSNDVSNNESPIMKNKNKTKLTYKNEKSYRDKLLLSTTSDDDTVSSNSKDVTTLRFFHKEDFEEAELSCDYLEEPVYDQNLSSSNSDKCNLNNANQGRKKIRNIMKRDVLQEDTKRAIQEEKERLFRLDEKKNTVLEAHEEQNQVILDIDPLTKKPTLTIHPSLVNVLKSHQVEGVKFMWDSCFESIEATKNNDSGGGCILAHCMGLGKTLQVITLVHTIFNSESLKQFKKVLICCPLTAVLNWVDEFNKWLKNIELMRNIHIFELSRFRKHHDRGFLLEEWNRKGGVFIIGYDMYKYLVNMTTEKCKVQQNFIDRLSYILSDPGPDLVICDEGHLLKNYKTQISIAMNKIRTKRRIVLTGTPLQNNLMEYYCMVNFVKPNLLGTQREYVNRFQSPITNGQHCDSNERDIKIMKRRSHVLHKILEGCIQRKEASVLYEYLPKKMEYVLIIPLTSIQAEIYEMYLNHVKMKTGLKSSLLNDMHMFQKIWTHPKILFKIKPPDLPWLSLSVENVDDLGKLETSNKLMVAFAILEECLEVNDKLVIFSTSLMNLDIFEYFLINEKNWVRGRQYYRLDGSVNTINRRRLCQSFNSNKNVSTKLLLVSTKVGGLGINMLAANRVIILDISWNPSQDIQSIFRIYRFGQTKECFVYRLVSSGTMEEKIYERSVTKQAVSCRVVDEQQINRHYSMAELAELYRFTHLPSGPRPVPMLPYDGVLANVLSKLRTSDAVPHIWSVHEHDSLLQNLCDENLDEDERKVAWVEYEQEKLAKENIDFIPKNIPSSQNVVQSTSQKTIAHQYCNIRVQESNKIIYQQNVSYEPKNINILNSALPNVCNNSTLDCTLKPIIPGSSDSNFKNKSSELKGKRTYVLPNGKVLHKLSMKPCAKQSHPISPKKIWIHDGNSKENTIDLTLQPDTPERLLKIKAERTKVTPNKTEIKHQRSNRVKKRPIVKRLFSDKIDITSTTSKNPSENPTIGTIVLE